MDEDEALDYNLLVLAPHPDDAELGCFGAIRHHHQWTNGQVHVAQLTIPRQETERRLKEAEAAAEATGYQLHVMTWKDRLEDDLRVDAVVSAWVNSLARDLRINRVLVPSVYDSNQDHVAAAQLGWQLARLGLDLLFYETPSTLTRFSPNLFIEVDLVAKLEVVDIHASQLERRGWVDLRRWVLQKGQCRGVDSHFHETAEGYEVGRLIW